MSTRNLDAVFHPRSVAIFGASRRAGAVGKVVFDNMLAAGFPGDLYAVNPKYKDLAGIACYPNVASLPTAPDLAVVCTPPATVPGLIEELGRRGTRAAVVITAGFSEGGHAAGEALEQTMLAAARPYMLRVIGPNCVGVISPRAGLNASFAQLFPNKGKLAFIAQSGAVNTAVLDWAHARGIGFSHLISLGDMADADFGDMLDYLADDGGTNAILLYMEGVTHARKFMSAARAASRSKPVIVVKAGRFRESAQAAASHTGALAGADAVYEAAFRRAGMLRVQSLEQLFEAAEVLAAGMRPKGDRLAILTNGGGMGVLATDALIAEGGHLAELSADTLQQLDASLPVTWSHGNPVDIIGDAQGARYADALAPLLDDKNVDAVLAINCPTAIASSDDAARAVLETYTARGKGKPLLASWLGEATVQPARQRLAAAGLPDFNTPEQAVRAFMYTVRYRRAQAALIETPPALPDEIRPDLEAARAVIAHALAEGREWLDRDGVRALLGAYGIPLPVSLFAKDVDEAAAAAAKIGYPVVLKVVSPQLSHKSDVGGVVLDLGSEDAVRTAAAAIAERVRANAPDAAIEGFEVNQMIKRPRGVELIAGLATDATFGPVVLFGRGGTAVEVINDRALALPPLNMELARTLVSRTRVARQLAGYRDVPPADMEAIGLNLMRIAQIAGDLPEVQELDINPLLADATGVVALDARVRVAPSKPGQESGAHLAIRPYPQQLESEVTTRDGRKLRLRPIRPEDEPAIQGTFSRLSPEEIRLRFAVPMTTLPHVMAARFSQIDYDREMALVLTDPGPVGHADIHAVVRLIADPDNRCAEFSIIVARALTGQGLGRMLMERIIAYARERGLQTVIGEILRENDVMLRLCRKLGFRLEALPDDPGNVRAVLDLSDTTPQP